MCGVEHRFFHADRDSTLHEGKILQLSEGGGSRFGETYVGELTSLSFDKLSLAAKREFVLEDTRKRYSEFHVFSSRLVSMFGANSIEDAALFAQIVLPVPEKPIRIFEVFATRFWTLDMNWMDYAYDPRKVYFYAKEYWSGRITNHAPERGERRPPRLEVLIPLPARIGKVVALVEGGVMSLVKNEDALITRAKK